VAAEGGTHYLVARSKLGRYVLDRDGSLSVQVPVAG
jgi:hypothetical protein